MFIMKQKVTIILALLTTAISASAKERTQAEMQRVARQYLLTSEARSDTPSSKTINLSMLAENTMISMIGQEGRGFVLVAKDDAFPAVVGYSTNASVEINPALQWYMTTAEMCMQDYINKNLKYAPVLPPSEFPDSVGALITTKWNQGNPYNKKCPGGNGNQGKLYPTGCVATALSQIMRYHKYPEVGIGDHQYSFKPASGEGRLLYANFGETHYDWDNMIDDYSKEYTDEQADAVSTLMAHCGVAVEMGYSASGSGSYGQEACLGLKKYFGYNKNARLYHRDFYSIELWMRMIYRELSLQRPIYYDGVSGNGGHAFVFHGYNENGLVLVNWGWGGSSDGYYDVALLNPSSYQFTSSQSMIIGICDSTQIIPYESQVVANEMSFKLLAKYFYINCNSLYNAAAEKFTGTIACILENDERTIVLKNTDEMTLNPITGGRWFTTSVSFQNINLSSSTIPDGTYRLYVGSRADDDTRWQLVRTLEGEVNSYIMEKSGSDVTLTEVRDDLWSDHTTTDIKTIKSELPNNNYYDLHGRRIVSPRKGLYIQNGRKVVIK